MKRVAPLTSASSRVGFVLPSCLFEERAAIARARAAMAAQIQQVATALGKKLLAGAGAPGRR
jgi:hypothetical protein